MANSRLVLTLAAALLVLQQSALLADDTFSTAPVSIAGTIATESNAVEVATITPLTIAHIFTVLGRLEDPRDYRFYFDLTADSFVIAARSLDPKTNHSATITATPLVTVFAYNSQDQVQLDPKRGPGLQANSNDTALDGNLSGTSVLRFIKDGKKNEEATKFVVFGTLQQTRILIQGSIVVRLKG